MKDGFIEPLMLEYGYLFFIYFVIGIFTFYFLLRPLGKNTCDVEERKADNSTPVFSISIILAILCWFDGISEKYYKLFILKDYTHAVGQNVEFIFWICFYGFFSFWLCGAYFLGVEYFVAWPVENVIVPVSDWFIVEFISITTKQGREHTKFLRESKKREKTEAQKIHEALKMEKKSIPKLPATLDTNQITKDIDYLETLDNKSYLVKYAGDFRDRFIAKGQTKTYNEIEKLVSAKTAVETALSSLAFAQEDRYTSQERAQAEYLLKTLKAQDDIRQHHSTVKEREDLANTELEIKKAELEARLLKAKLEAEQARKGLSDLQAPPEQARQKKTEMERFEGQLESQTQVKKMMMVSKKAEEDINFIKEVAKKEGWSAEKLEQRIELAESKWQKFMQEKIK